MIRILYLCETLKTGGAEQLLLTTIKYMDRNRFSPIVYCLGEKGEIGREIEKTGVAVTSLGKKSYLWRMSIILDLVRILRKEKPDILHTHLFYANYFGRIAAIFARVPVVVITEHGTYSNFKKYYHHWIDYILSFFSNRIIAVSKAVEEYLLKHTWISPVKIKVIYNAVDVDRFFVKSPMDRNLARQKMGFSDTDVLIGCVSTLAPWKGQMFLMQAFVNILNSMPSAHLCIVGRDNNGFKKRLESYAEEKRISSHVHFLGERRDIPEILSGMDVFVLPSLSEGLGIAVLEAMCIGLPIVASRTEGILEIIEDDKDGVLVKPGDVEALAIGILALLKDKEKMKKMGYNAKEKIKRFFAPEGYIEKLQACYGELSSA